MSATKETTIPGQMAISRENVLATSLHKLESITSPEGDIGSLDLADIFDVRSLQSLVDNFYKLTGLPMGLIDLNGKVLVGVGWQGICTKFHRLHPETSRNCIESDLQLSAGVPVGKYKIYKCKNHLWDVATPVMVGDRQFGNLFMGQFFFEDEQPDYGLFRAQAAKYGFDEKEYIAALDAVPRLSRATLDTSMAFFMELAEILSKQSYSNLKLTRSLAERDTLMESLRESEERERIRAEELTTVLDAVPAAVWIASDPSGQHITGNKLSCNWLHLPDSANVSKSAPDGEKTETIRMFKNDVELSPAEMPVQLSAAGAEIRNYDFTFVYPDNTKRYVLGNATPLFDKNGKPRGSVSAFIDITEHHRAAEEVRRRVEELRVVNEDLERFNSASVGRELRMIELKKEINALCVQSGQPQRYALDFDKHPFPDPETR